MARQVARLARLERIIPSPATEESPTLGETLAALSDPDVREMAGLVWLAVTWDLVPDPAAMAQALAPRHGHLFPAHLNALDQAHAARWALAIGEAGDPTPADLRALIRVHRPWPDYWPGPLLVRQRF